MWWRWMVRRGDGTYVPGLSSSSPNCDTVPNTELLLFDSVMTPPNDKSDMNPFAWTNTSVFCAMAVWVVG